MSLPADPLAPLSGALPARAIGARCLEPLARHPRCDWLKAPITSGVRTSDAATMHSGETEEGRSPFTIAVGSRSARSWWRNR